MPRYRGKHRKRSTSGRTIATTAVAGAVAGIPLMAIPASAASNATWDRVAQCESGGRWHTATGNGYYGGLQFSRSTWTGFGGGQFAPMAHQASREQQIAVAERVLAKQGWNAWPTCSRKAGAVGQPATNRAAPAKPANPAPRATKPATPKKKAPQRSA
ncbi:MAG: transglycosylase family protein, partial [Actinomycetota bacterium]|nr:transglycosylase family protein [Actinomycetota bacterium]